MKETLFVEQLRDYYREEENHRRALDDWFELIKIPSVSEDKGPICACAEQIAAKMRALGIDVDKYELPESPLLVGHYGNDPAKKTVMIYAHYDVKPAGNLQLWNTEPFQPTIIDGKVYARGASDNKAPLMAHLKALEYYQETGQDVPVNLVFVFEGNEEAGSAGLDAFLESHRSSLAADVVFFSDGPRDPSGLPIIALGAKGTIGLTLRCRTMSHDVHSRYAPVLPSAMWRMISLLKEFKQGDHILIPGFYDDMIPFSERDRELIQGLPSSEESLNMQYEAVSSHYGEEYYPRLLGDPTFNINEIRGGGKGVVPSVVEADIDIRLAPGQSPKRIVACIDNYIHDVLGYDDVEILIHGMVPASKTDPNTPYLDFVRTACRKIYGEYIIYPCRPSTAPDYLWTNVLGLPAIQVRWSDADSNNHAPNEHLSIDEYFDGIALTAETLRLFAGMDTALGENVI